MKPQIIIISELKVSWKIVRVQHYKYKKYEYNIFTLVTTNYTDYWFTNGWYIYTPSL